MSKEGFNFSQLGEEPSDYGKLFSDESEKQLCNLLRCDKNFIDRLFDPEDKKLHFDEPLLVDKCVPGDVHVYDGNTGLLPMPKIASYPAYIYSPLRVLNKWNSAFFPDAVKELEQIISKGELTFDEKFPLGLGSVGNHPFVLSKRKADVIIVLVNAKTFEQNKSNGILSQDGFACYLHYDILGTSYPVIIIDAEDLEAAFTGKTRAEQIILAYQFDVLEMFAYAIKEVYPKAYEGDDHFAFKFAREFLKNVGKEIKLKYKTVQHFFDMDEDVYIAIREEDLNALKAEVDKMRQRGELTEEEIKSGIYGEGIVDIIDWEKKYIRFMDDFGMKRYEYPVSIDLNHPYTWWAV